MKLAPLGQFWAIWARLTVLVFAAVLMGYALRQPGSECSDRFESRLPEPRGETVSHDHESSVSVSLESSGLRSGVPSAEPNAGTSLVFAEDTFESEENDIEQIIAGWPVGEIRARLEELHTEEAFFSEQQETLLRHWAAGDAAEALRWAGALSSSSEREAARRQVAMGWSQTDARTATDWVEGWPDRSAKFSTLLELGYDAAANDTAAAMILAEKLPRSGERNALLAHAVSQSVSIDWAAPLHWAKAKDDPALRGRLVAAIALPVAERDGAAAATIIVTELAPGEALNRAAVSVAQRWMQTDYESASAWIDAFPESAAKEASTRTLEDFRRVSSR